FKRVNDDEKSFHFLKLITYCILKKSEGTDKTKFTKELFKLYELLLKQNYYRNKRIKYIENTLFRNIVTNALDLKEFEWTKNFIDRYSEKLHPESKENILNMCYAQYNLELGISKMNKVILNTAHTCLSKIQDDNFIYKYNVRNLFIKLYFEQEDYDSAFNQIEKYKRFLSRNNLITPKRKKKARIFLNHVEKLLMVKTGKHEIDISDLHFDILKQTAAMEQKWLAEKISQIDKMGKNKLILKNK
ncbi:MAG TPA: hypothetical protein VEX17_01785, partial [Bacillales bacterium]|nr:hypothetical protein [Bacillales bacterium]